MIRKHIYHIIIVLLVAINIHAQETEKSIFLSTGSIDKAEIDPVVEKALKNGEIKGYYPINLNTSFLKNLNNLSMTIDGKEFNLDNIKRDIKGINRYNIVGNLNGNKQNFASFTVMNGVVAGSVFNDGATYQIYTSKNGKHYLFEINTSFDCGTIEDKKPVGKSMKNLPAGQNNQVTLKSIPNYGSRLFATTSNCCKMRIIVLYTPAVLALNANIQVTIQQTVDNANDFMTTSLVYEEWELAYCGLTNYDEYYIDPGDGRFTDLARFRINNDGYMDEVHDLRDQYNADICVLISECQYTTQCGGVASAIDANTSNAFCLVHAQSWGGISTNVFSHEIGHLLAGRHDNDGGSSPYGYNHGYRHYSPDWGTVMATTSTIHYWSNPYVDYNGQPTGTLDWNYMAEVLRDEVPEKVAFYQPVSNLTLTSNDVTNISIGDAISQNSIVTSGSMTVPSGAVLNMSSNEITLNAGFTIQSGAEVEILNESVISCP